MVAVAVAFPCLFLPILGTWERQELAGKVVGGGGDGADLLREDAPDSRP